VAKLPDAIIFANDSGGFAACVQYRLGGQPMRFTPIAIALTLLSSPALAAPQQDAERAVRVLQDPLAQEVATGVLSQVVGVVLDTRVGPLASVLDPERDVRPNDTLGDLKRREDPISSAGCSAIPAARSARQRRPPAARWRRPERSAGPWIGWKPCSAR
jgi:hypothetical protein